jgi:hypothetical protein
VAAVVAAAFRRGAEGKVVDDKQTHPKGLVLLRMRMESFVLQR